MKTYNTREGQTLFDVALQLYGSEQEIVQILKDNTNLNINSELKNGTPIKYTLERNEFSDYVTDKKIEVNTGGEFGNNIGGGFGIGFNEGFN